MRSRPHRRVGEHLQARPGTRGPDRGHRRLERHALRHRRPCCERESARRRETVRARLDLAELHRMIDRSRTRVRSRGVGPLSGRSDADPARPRRELPALCWGSGETDAALVHPGGGFAALKSMDLGRKRSIGFRVAAVFERTNRRRKRPGCATTEAAETEARRRERRLHWSLSLHWCGGGQSKHMQLAAPRAALLLPRSRRSLRTPAAWPSTPTGS